MIVPMKKAFIITQQKDAGEAVRALREAGVVHVEHFKPPAGDTVSRLTDEVRQGEETLRELKAYADQEAPAQASQVNLAGALDLLNQRDSVQEKIHHYNALIHHWEKWGDFEPSDIKDLASRGLSVSLVELPIQKFESLGNDVTFEELGREGKLVRGLLVTPNDQDPHPNEKLRLHFESLSVMKKQLLSLDNKLKTHNESLAWVAQDITPLQKELLQIKGRLAVALAHEGMEVTGGFSVLKGYIPKSEIQKLTQIAKQHNWGISVQDTAPDERPPTLLKNPSWVELIKPVFKVIEILPGYRELDVSPVFLIFFTLFFAILIGDAAYGLIFMGCTVLVHLFKGKKIPDKKPLFLSYILSAGVVVWGLLTGTFFGQSWLPSSVKPLLPWLTDFQNMQLLCFIIALIHLTIAKLWAIIRRWPSVTMLAEVGWLLIIWGMFFVANMFVLDFKMPGFALYFFYLGLPLAFFFMVEPKVWLKSVGQQTVPFALGVVGAGTDIISYIRLFAVGLATVAIADATNSMAAGMPLPAMILILILGHALNLVLAAMAILVHAIRLNVLEFSGQLGLEWSGHPYEPLRKQAAEQ